MFIKTSPPSWQEGQDVGAVWCSKNIGFLRDFAFLANEVMNGNREGLSQYIAQVLEEASHD